MALQSEVRDPSGPHGRENSWGLAQIWLDKRGHPEVSRAQAIDPEFAVDWAGKEFAAGKEHEFHCYDKEKAKGWK